MKQFWQDKRHGPPVKGAAAEGPAASGGQYEDDLQRLGHRLKELRINVETIQTRQQKDTAGFQGVVRRIEAEQGRHTARLDQVDDHQELHAKQVNHATRNRSQRHTRCCFCDSIDCPDLIYKLIIVTYKAHTDGESSSSQTRLHLLKPPHHRLHIKSMKCRAASWIHVESYLLHAAELIIAGLTKPLRTERGFVLLHVGSNALFVGNTMTDRLQEDHV